MLIKVNTNNNLSEMWISCVDKKREEKYVGLQCAYSTVTDFARFLGWSTSRSLTTAM